MATLQDIRRKIGGVKKTQQITKAMNMVAAAKLRGAQMRMENFRPYAGKFLEVINNLSSRIDPEAFPLMAQRPVKKVELVSLTADRGLCGSFNVNLINQGEKFVKARKQEQLEVSLVPVGKKGGEYYKRQKYDVRVRYMDIFSSFDMVTASGIGRDIMANFLAGGSDEVYILYGEFINMAVQRPKLLRLLPIAPLTSKQEGSTGTALDYIYEPSVQGIFQELLPRYVNVQIYRGMLENAASEQAARMTAMDNATRNCKELINSLSLIYNKARQGAITKELMDIVGGAEALK
ncbi:MAG TPA: ATP synthase F1 subunit gamma [Thermodesulfobacteriota bacterium]|nr:ATP synthase F1 subunit gamma [Thermodesulfobacteriota bacterium]